MIHRFLLFLTAAFIVILVSSCGQDKKADKVFYNGNIYLVDEAFSKAEAMAVLNGRIKMTGSSADLLAYFKDAEKVDLEGATVFPGFIDGHCHFYGYATDLMKCDLYGTTSYDEVIARLIPYAAENKFSWILGRGWDQNDWEDKSYPDNTVLDSLFPDKPVYLMRIDGHAVLCNSKALEMAGIKPGMNIPGGEIVQKDGKATGLLIDNAIDIVKKMIPPFTPELIDEALLKAQGNCFAAGLTSLTEAGLGVDSIRTLLNLQKSGKLKMRIYAMMSNDVPTLNYFFDKGPYKDERMSVKAIKVYTDGALGSRGACLSKEYSDQPGHYGYMLYSREYLDKLADKAIEHDFQLCAHAIGDSAASVIVDVYKSHLSPDNRRRWRIEHCQVIDPPTRKSMGENSIIASVQPTHAMSDMYWAEERIGKDRMAYAYAYEDLRKDCNGMIVFGTDFPVENISPLLTYYAAVARKDLSGFPKDGFQPENKVKKKDAIRAMTIWAAYANFEDGEKGSLEAGKYADFVILDQDLLEIKTKDIPDTRVLATYVNGERVFPLK